MSELDLNHFYNSGQLFSHLQQNKNLLTIFLEDGTKLSGRLLGWDSDYLLILYGKTLQIVPVVKLTRLQVDLDNNASVAEQAAAKNPELLKPKSSPVPQTGNEIKDQIIAEKIQNCNKDKPARDRLDNLVRNW